MNLSQYFNQNQANASDLDIYKFVIDKINKIKPEDKNGKKYIVTVNGIKIYHAGDTDFIPEMKNFECNIALLPVSGTYVMTAKEAVEAAEAIKPGVAIPMHWGDIVGSKKDAEYFRDHVSCECIIKEKE